MATTKTTVGDIDPEVLRFTAGEDRTWDRELVEADCIGTAAHVVMLSRMDVDPPVIGTGECDAVIEALKDIIRADRAGKFRISEQDQDVHLAVERRLTRELGDTGRRVHTGRSRNDQSAVDLRLYTKRELLELLSETARLAGTLLDWGRERRDVPMPGRTHMQPAMPSSLGLWASAFAEGLLDDLDLLMHVYGTNDRCPLGAAASYGVPLPLDRELTSRLLGFSSPVHNVLHANHTRGKLESLVLAALSQVMLTVSRLSQDLMLFTMPELGYVQLPDDFCTGSSIMPQKRNPDVLELVRARTAGVLSAAGSAAEIMRGLPSGYNRDVQESKGALIKGLADTRACVRILQPLIAGMREDRDALLRGFTPGIFATDRALELVGEGVPFREAYRRVRRELRELDGRDPEEAVKIKDHAGAPAGLDWKVYRKRVRAAERFVRNHTTAFNDAVSDLLKAPWPELAPQSGDRKGAGKGV
ncbi:argininosuccinate lyase [Kiritimatiella glycovorans]|uniref:Argininosuccinate lyase n=1 Tax=Kiritimatiella glycovorans TaxID=1307763 RepID=A0A0G3EK37_9BACT|nr:argininosuccinate lyase [Kiritimatiella glycovorans]AKJ64509.1 Argininosuccinate lyase [Kiritimatiella glycovorans]